MQQPRQMLELTSEDCLWRASQPGMAGAGAAWWRTIDKPQLLRLGEPAFCPFFPKDVYSSQGIVGVSHTMHINKHHPTHIHSTRILSSIHSIRIPPVRIHSMRVHSKGLHQQEWQGNVLQMHVNAKHTPAYHCISRNAN